MREREDSRVSPTGWVTQRQGALGGVTRSGVGISSVGQASGPVLAHEPKSTKNLKN